MQFGVQRKVAARLQYDLRREVRGESRLEHFHLVLARGQSFENKIALSVRGSHINGVCFMVGHDDGRIRNSGITDIENRAGEFSGQVLAGEPESGERKQQAHRCNSGEQPRLS